LGVGCVATSGESMIVIRTLNAPGLVLEPQLASHADEMFAVLNDAEVYTYLHSTPPPSAEAMREHFALLESRLSTDGRELWLNWAIRLETGELAGFVQATVCEDGLGWTAFVIGRAFWGRGIAYLATRAMLDDLTESEGVTLWLATADRRNQRSLRLLSRLGFTLAPQALRHAHEVDEGDVLMRLVHAAAAIRPG
jgi:[ribosomal protein S5]-alanine N-acetyltransferase